MFRKLMNFMRNIATDVPEEIAVCEFDCTKAECLLGDWKHCERRLNAHAAQPRDMDERAGE